MKWYRTSNYRERILLQEGKRPVTIKCVNNYSIENEKEDLLDLLTKK